MIIMPFLFILLRCLRIRRPETNKNQKLSLLIIAFFFFGTFSFFMLSRTGKLSRALDKYLLFSCSIAAKKNQRQNSSSPSESQRYAMPHHHNWTLFNSMSNVSINKHFSSIILHTKVRALFSMRRPKRNFSPHDIGTFFSPFNSHSDSSKNAFKANEQKTLNILLNWKRKKKLRRKWLGPLNWKSHIFWKMMNGLARWNEEILVINAHSSGRKNFFANWDKFHVSKKKKSL